MELNSTKTELVNGTEVKEPEEEETVENIVILQNQSFCHRLQNATCSHLKRITTWDPPKWSQIVLTRLFIPLFIWMTLYLVLYMPPPPDQNKSIALPGGIIFTLCIIVFGGLAIGELLKLIKLPPLLGMLLLGIIIRNVPIFAMAAKVIDATTSSGLRRIALVVILTRAGLGLDPEALMKLKGVVFRLAFCPCIAEAITIAVASYFILNFPWLWGFMLGFVLAAVSPAVIVPNLLSLNERGYGVAKGIPTIVIAASSCDDILAISAFSLFMGLQFSMGNSLVESIFHGPLEVIIGIVYGILWGCILGIFFGQKDSDKGNLLIIRIILTLVGGCVSVFGFEKAEYSGSGALGCLVGTFVAAVFWRRKGVLSENSNLSKSFAMLWYIFETLLFGLIGCQIDLSNLKLDVTGRGLLCLGIGLTVRVIATYFTVAGAGLNLKERLFISIAWVPKATVQAAIGGLAWDKARETHAGEANLDMGQQVLTIAVLSILITAPIGAVGVMTLGPLLLTSNKKTDTRSRQDIESQSKSDPTIGNGSKNDENVLREEELEPLTNTNRTENTKKSEDSKGDDVIVNKAPQNNTANPHFKLHDL